LHRKTSEIKVISLNPIHIHKATFSKKYQFGSKEKKSYFDEIVKQAEKNQTKLHLLQPHKDLESLYTNKQFIKLENTKHIFFLKLD